MPQFSPDQVSFGDLAGYGSWETGHYREHLQFVQVLAGMTPAVLIPDRDLFPFLTAGQARKSQIESHAAIHALLRAVTGVQGTDLSAVDLDDGTDFNNWLGYHSSEHSQIRQALGIV